MSAEIISYEGDRAGRVDSGPSVSETETAFRRLAAGDLGALEELYDLEADGLYALALWVTGSREDAADVVQEVFVKLASRRGRLSGVRRPRAYLLTMARSAAVDRVRSDRPRDAELPEAELLEAPPSGTHPGPDARMASRHLRRLPLRQREAVYLRYFAELSFAEIGRVTGVSLFTAASRCRLGLRKLRQWMGVEP